MTLILGIAIPRLSRSTDAQKVKTSADITRTIIETAKSYATAQNCHAAYVYDNATKYATVHREDIDDADGDGDRTELIAYEKGAQIPSGVTVTLSDDNTSDNSIVFSASGRTQTSGETIVITNTSGSKTRTLTVNAVTGYVDVA